MLCRRILANHCERLANKFGPEHCNRPKLSRGRISRYYPIQRLPWYDQGEQPLERCFEDRLICPQAEQTAVRIFFESSTGANVCHLLLSTGDTLPTYCCTKYQHTSNTVSRSDWLPISFTIMGTTCSRLASGDDQHPRNTYGGHHTRPIPGRNASGKGKRSSQGCPWPAASRVNPHLGRTDGKGRDGGAKANVAPYRDKSTLLLCVQKLSIPRWPNRLLPIHFTVSRLFLTA